MQWDGSEKILVGKEGSCMTSNVIKSTTRMRSTPGRQAKAVPGAGGDKGLLYRGEGNIDRGVQDRWMGIQRSRKSDPNQQTETSADSFEAEAAVSPRPHLAIIGWYA